MKVNTLLISADGTYPGIVLEPRHTLNVEYWCRVKWYKWGYKSPDFMDGIEMISQVESLVATPNEVFRKFYALPPEYNASLGVSEPTPEEEIRRRITNFLGEYHDAEEGIGAFRPQEIIDDCVDYVLGLLK